MGFEKVWGVCLFSVSLFIVFAQDYPVRSSDDHDRPPSRFTCKNKVDGGYYADIATDCKMFHVCVRNKEGKMRSTKFRCGQRTVFDQQHLVCQDHKLVPDCQDSRKYYGNVAYLLELYKARLTEEKPEDDDTVKDYPTYSSDNMPHTRFSCKNKVNGGYYADIETECQMYHVCAKNKDGKMRSTKFLCGNGTVFDQRHLVCQDYKRVQNCRNSRKYYRNVATRLELLEARMRTEGTDKEIMEAEEFDAGRE